MSIKSTRLKILNKIQTISQRCQINSGPFQKRSRSVYENVIHLFFARHLYAAITSLGRMSRTPFSTLMTVTVIGLSLALPLGLYLIQDTAQKLSRGWDKGTYISLYLNSDVTLERVETLLAELTSSPHIAEVNYISKEQGLEEFQKYSGFGEILNNLAQNPLPAVIEVKPTVLHQNPEALENLLQRLNTFPEVELAQLDMQWVKRLNAIIHVTNRAMFSLSIMLSIGVILVVGNTIRLATEKYREELEVITLVGATKGFVRRPFLYVGAFYGVFGGVIAWLCVDFSLLWLAGPIDNLASLYNGHFQLEQFGAEALFMVVGIGGLLGWLGSFLVVEKHLRSLPESL